MVYLSREKEYNSKRKQKRNRQRNQRRKVKNSSNNLIESRKGLGFDNRAIEDLCNIVKLIQIEKK